jgi:hypothetical protein
MRFLSPLRNLAAAAALVAVTALPLAADAANFAGTWAFTGSLNYHGKSSTTAPVCTLRQSGNTLAGSCKAPNFAGPATGTVSGRSIVLQWHATNAAGLKAVATMRGTWGADGVVRGTITSTSWPAAGILTGQKM